MEIGDIYIYIYMVRVRHISSAGPVLRNVEELSVSQFYNIVTTGNEH